jgi:hypothetical protein
MANDLRSFEKAIDDLREAEPKATREAAELILLGRIAQGLEQGALTLDEAQALDERLGGLRAKHADALDLVGGIDVPAPQPA